MIIAIQICGSHVGSPLQHIKHSWVTISFDWTQSWLSCHWKCRQDVSRRKVSFTYLQKNLSSCLFDLCAESTFNKIGSVYSISNLKVKETLKLVHGVPILLECTMKSAPSQREHPVELIIKNNGFRAYVRSQIKCKIIYVTHHLFVIHRPGDIISRISALDPAGPRWVDGPIIPAIPVLHRNRCGWMLNYMNII